MPDAEPLAPGDRFRLAPQRARVAAFGLRLDERGTVTVPQRGPVELQLDGEPLRVVPIEASWQLALTEADGGPVASYVPERGRRGTIDGELVLDFVRGKERTGTPDRDGTQVAAVSVKNGVVLVEPQTALDPRTAAFVATVVLLDRLRGRSGDDRGATDGSSTSEWSAATGFDGTP